MSNRNVQENQQQGQGVTIGTQGNEDQVTPKGEDVSYRNEESREDRSIPNQEKSSATTQDQQRTGTSE